MKIRKMAMSGAAAVALILTVSVTPASAGPAQAYPERYANAATAWGFMATDKPTIDTWLNQYNGRVIDVERTVNGGWSVLTVDNDNPTYERSPSGSFSWTVDETLASLNSKLNSKRLLDVESYTVGGSIRYAAAWVDSSVFTGGFQNLPLADVEEKVDECVCRIIDIDPTGGGKYNVIMVGNLFDWVDWTWDESMSELEIHQKREQGYRPVDIEPASIGRYAVVFVRDGLAGSFRVERTWNQLAADLPPGNRPIHTKEYTNAAGQLVWLQVWMQNG